MQLKYSFKLLVFFLLTIGLGSHPMGGGQRDASVERRQDCDSRSSHPVGSKEYCRIKGWAFFLSMSYATTELFCAGPLATPSMLLNGPRFAGRTDG